MKNKLLLIAVAFGFLVSCSNSDDSSGPAVETNFMPVTIGNYWVYNVTGSDNSIGRDSLYIANDTVINTNTYKKFKTESIPTGFFSNTLRGNSVREVNGKLLLTGGAGLNVANALPIDLELTDFVVFDKNATENQQLSSVSGTLQQTLQGFPLTINYTLKSIAQAEEATYTAPDNTVYNNLKPVKTILNVAVTGTYQGFPFTLLEAQDVVTSTQYYAEGIGMVHANTNISYHLVDLSLLNIQFPFPSSGSQSQTEVLDDYHVMQNTTN
ncbi:hypothetical protein [Flavobacterium pallidum]|uniref:Lipoprotein n=1 Tax=Flavobacterium pallidum TaxID=2172098 RepID=A0A2S1SJ55_9FLAO|nr:hypothetical protein [Flavobacterium pallidum]AWI26433.1 hypothetical protein HYN49_11270 [Flavobacterium pallidum]